MSEKGSEIHGVTWDGKDESFPAIKTQVEARAVGLRCTHATIVNDVARAAYAAGNVASRKRKQETFWSLLIATFAEHNSTWAEDFPVTNGAEPGTDLWKAIIAWHSQGTTKTSQMIRTEYRTLLGSFTSTFKGDWDKFSIAVQTGLSELNKAGL